VDVPLLWRELDLLFQTVPNGRMTVIEGASDDVTGPYFGADYWAHQWALARDVETIRQHARWKELGRKAGPIRNEEMIRLHKPDLVMAFPGNRGTANMADQAHRAGIDVIFVPANEQRNG